MSKEREERRVSYVLTLREALFNPWDRLLVALTVTPVLLTCIAFIVIAPSYTLLWVVLVLLMFLHGKTILQLLVALDKRNRAWTILFVRDALCVGRNPDELTCVPFSACVVRHGLFNTTLIRTHSGVTIVIPARALSYQACKELVSVVYPPKS